MEERMNSECIRLLLDVIYGESFTVFRWLIVLTGLCRIYLSTCLLACFFLLLLLLRMGLCFSNESKNHLQNVSFVEPHFRYSLSVARNWKPCNFHAVIKTIANNIKIGEIKRASRTLITHIWIACLTFRCLIESKWCHSRYEMMKNEMPGEGGAFWISCSPSINMYFTVSAETFPSAKLCSFLLPSIESSLFDRPKVWWHKNGFLFNLKLNQC